MIVTQNFSDGLSMAYYQTESALNATLWHQPDAALKVNQAGVYLGRVYVWTDIGFMAETLVNISAVVPPVEDGQIHTSQYMGEILESITKVGLCGYVHAHK